MNLQDLITRLRRRQREFGPSGKNDIPDLLDALEDAIETLILIEDLDDSSLSGTFLQRWEIK